jgi:valyl-tRNA synthetase
MAVIGGLRSIRAEYDVAPSKTISVTAYTDSSLLTSIIEETDTLIKSLAKVDELQVLPLSSERIKGAATAVVDDVELLVPLKGLVDFAAERKRLAKEKEKTSKQIAGAEKKLSNEKFLSKAPKEVVAKEQAKLDEGKVHLEKIDQALSRLDELEK